MQGNTEYDAAVVFDADNLVKENFLKAMNTRLLQGEKIIQAYIDAKNPDDNWVTATFSMMFWINDRYNLLSRFNVGLSSVLMGTGMCISKESLAEIGWDTVTLTEDLEYSIQALLKDTKTTFARETKIFDEKPVSFYASCRQRLRWGRGQLSVLFKYIPKMMLQGIKDLNIVKIDSGLRLIQQPFLMFYFVVTLLRISFPATFNSPLFNLFIRNIKTLGFILPLMPYLIPSSVYFLDNLSFSSFKYIVFFPIFMYSWILILYYALFTLDNKSWLPTKHFRNVSRDELQKDLN
ncbi:MAG TPA: glycosyltransferase family 2 protein [Halanaerobiales bacterium]|nr:glycosyltransferase family 2 protein [Halanaerobiales bacterium]